MPDKLKSEPTRKVFSAMQPCFGQCLDIKMQGKGCSQKECFEECLIEAMKSITKGQITEVEFRED